MRRVEFAAPLAAGQLDVGGQDSWGDGGGGGTAAVDAGSVDCGGGGGDVGGVVLVRAFMVPTYPAGNAGRLGRSGFMVVLAKKSMGGPPAPHYFQIV